jgi:hypothetical protein
LHTLCDNKWKTAAFQFSIRFHDNAGVIHKERFKSKRKDNIIEETICPVREVEKPLLVFADMSMP